MRIDIRTIQRIDKAETRKDHMSTTERMTIDEVRGEIESILNRLLTQKGLEKIQVQDDMRLLGGPIQIDSIDLAVLITEMEEATRKDPFKAGFRDFRTVGELAKMYAD